MADDQTANKITAYYDGKCPMCAALMNAVSCSAEAASFALHDMHKQKSLPFARDAVEKEIHVVDGEGGLARCAGYPEDRCRSTPAFGCSPRRDSYRHPVALAGRL